jgi:hypothetical protein
MRNNPMDSAAFFTRSRNSIGPRAAFTGKKRGGLARSYHSN